MFSKLENVGAVEINGEVIHIFRDETKLYSGLVFNAGFCPIDEFEIDSDLSIDENIQVLVEAL